MARPTKADGFKKIEARPEAPMDKTTRAVKKIIDGETEKRQVKTARLRKARLEQEADASDKVVPPVASSARKKSSLKSAK